MSSSRKKLGQYFTSDEVASSLVSWVVRKKTDRILDPSCGDGQFLKHHRRSVGIEIDPDAAASARRNSPSSLIHGGDFFEWAAATSERFDGIAGNPPFIRFQTFNGRVRAQALAAASLMGADFSGLASSWAPFVLVAAGLLKPGGRMAFVVPAEIGHANYARELIPALCRHFGTVRLLACRKKLFPRLSEDCWLLWCDGFGSTTRVIGLEAVDEFHPGAEPPRPRREISLEEWQSFGGRLRPFLLSSASLSLYSELTGHAEVSRFGEVASANIGYVSGANDFFHLRPSEAKRFRIPGELLRVSIRKSSQLPGGRVRASDVKRWLREDEPVLLLDLGGAPTVPAEVRGYLDTEAGHIARTAYKCRNRKPWYAVPDIKVPHAFLSVMNGRRPSLIFNDAGCVCTNSLHAVTLREGYHRDALEEGWRSPLAELGAEIEGHPLGGGMLKLEPREAQRIPIPLSRLPLTPDDQGVLLQATATMRTWRHHG